MRTPDQPRDELPTKLSPCHSDARQRLDRQADVAVAYQFLGHPGHDAGHRFSLLVSANRQMIGHGTLHVSSK